MEVGQQRLAQVITGLGIGLRFRVVSGSGSGSGSETEGGSQRMDARFRTSAREGKFKAYGP